MTYEHETKDKRHPLRIYVSPRMRSAIEQLADLDRRDVSKWIRLQLEDVIRSRSDDLAG